MKDTTNTKRSTKNVKYIVTPSIYNLRRRAPITIPSCVAGRSVIRSVALEASISCDEATQLPLEPHYGFWREVTISRESSNCVLRLTALDLTSVCVLRELASQGYCVVHISVKRLYESEDQE